METPFTTYYSSPVGCLKITGNRTRLLAISFVDEQNQATDNLPPLLQQTVDQLSEYFAGTRQTFQLELAPQGSEFQQKVWRLLRKVPYGETRSYLDIAQQTGSEKNTRAVGLANGKNPIPIIIPCHRIIGSNGKLTGYAGGLERKRFLLLHEQKHSILQNRLF